MVVRKKPPTSQDVARLAGVSQSTVSYVLTGSRPISETTRARVQDAIDKLGYHPNSGARTLRSQRSGVIGLMVPEAESDDGVLMVFIGAIAREARRHGYDILLVTAQEGAEGIRRVVRTGVCEALILMELDRFDERVAPVIDSGLPFVTIGKPEEFPQGSVIDLDFEMLGAMVVERALEEQCDTLFLFGAPGRKRERNDVSRFLAGVEDAAEEAPLQVVLDASPLSEVPDRALRLTLPNQRTALFGITGVRQVLFAMAATGALVDDTRLLIALSGEDLMDVSPLLAALPQLDPRRTEISELAVGELVRLLEVDGAAPRVTFVEPRWLEG